MTPWHAARIAPNATHHLDSAGLPLYQPRFERVLKFHAPGLAPVRDDSGAYHVQLDGRQAYAARFLETFGYYEGLAAVAAGDGWTHVDTGGQPVYQRRYQWVGNVQEGRVPVRLKTGHYAHIDVHGQQVGQTWAYAGDYRDGVAVVQRSDGQHTHVDQAGGPVHGLWFDDLDVFHKGYARTRDGTGWTHVDIRGQPAYARRFASVEPFYNGQARVETQQGGLEVIDEEGHTQLVLRAPHRSELQGLSADLVGYWRTQTIHACVACGLVDALPSELAQIAQHVGASPSQTRRLLRAAWELGLVAPQGQAWAATARGALLEAGSGMEAATRLWARVHATHWAHVLESVRGDGPAGRRGGRSSFFDQLPRERQPAYYRAMRAYANDDYATLPDLVPWQDHQVVIDAGGGTGALLELLLARFTHLRGALLDLPEVVGLAPVHPHIEPLGVDLFSVWPAQGDAVVLARVLHDWPTDDAAELLTRAREALTACGRIYVLDMILDEHAPAGALLDLNMLATTGGRERSQAEWDLLFAQAGLRRLTAPQSLRPWVGLQTLAVQP